MKRPAFFYSFTLPPVLLAVCFGAAMLSILQYSLREYIPGSLDVGGFTLDNFVRMAKPVYARVFVDSLLLSFYTAVLTLLLGYPLAFALVRTASSTVKSIILILAITPLFTSEIVRTYAWTLVLGDTGFINSFLQGVGLTSAPIQLMYTKLGVTIALVQYSMPVMVVILAAAISHVDIDYEKAAASLGASAPRVLIFVTLPLSAPGIVSGFVTIFARSLSAFATPQLIGGGKVVMISNMVYYQGFSAFDFPFAAVLSLTALALTTSLLVYLAYSMRRFERIGLH